MRRTPVKCTVGYKSHDSHAASHNQLFVKMISSAMATITTPKAAPTQITAFRFTSSFALDLSVGGFLRAVLIFIILFSYRSKLIVIVFEEASNRYVIPKARRASSV